MDSIKLWARNGEAVRQAMELGDLVHLETASEELRFFAGVQGWDTARRAWVEAVTPRVVAALQEAAEAGLIA